MNPYDYDRPRPDVVRQIVDDMLNGPLERGEPFTLSELLSAVFTLLNSVCKTSIERSQNPAHTRQMLQNQLAKMLLEVAPPLGKAS